MTCRHEINMTEGPILSKVLLFAYPVMLSNVIQLLFNAADIIVVGKFAGSQSLAAVGSSTALINLLISIFTGISTGASVLTARFYGEQNKEKLSQCVHCSIALSLLLGSLVTILGLFLSTPLLKITNTDPLVLPLASTYLKYYFTGTPALLLNGYGSAILRAVGDSKRSMLFLTISGAVNVVLNLIFVVCFHWDVAGVAAATAISRYLSAFLCIRCLLQSDGWYRLEWKKIRFHRQMLWQLIVIGLPTGLTGSINNFANITIQSAVNSFGYVTMAGCSASSNITSFIYSAMNAFYQAALTFTSQNVGAKKFHRIKNVLACCIAGVGIVGLSLSAVTVLFGHELLGLYISKSDPQFDAILRAGQIRLFCTGTFAFISGFQEVSNGMLRGLGRSWLPLILSMIGTCLFRILWTHLIFPYYPSEFMLYLCFPVSWVLTSIILLAALFFVYQKQCRISPLAS